MKIQNAHVVYADLSHASKLPHPQVSLTSLFFFNDSPQFRVFDRFTAPAVAIKDSAGLKPRSVSGTDYGFLLRLCEIKNTYLLTSNPNGSGLPVNLGRKAFVERIRQLGRVEIFEVFTVQADELAGRVLYAENDVATMSVCKRRRCFGVGVDITEIE